MSWYQLAYGSVEKSAGRPGGWGVVAASTDLPAEGRSLLLDGVVTRIDELVPTNEFAVRSELEARVRCFSYAPDPHGPGGTWWHAVVAGKDATGRPGNVFTHALRTDRLDGQLRPVDLWRSPGWQTPFGAGEVAAVELTSPVEPGRAPRGGFEIALAHQQSEVEAVLAAVASCLADDRALVLAVGSTDEFIDWMRAVSSLTSAGMASRIPFCTFVRAEALRARAQQFEILGIPREDLPALIGSLTSEPGGPLVLDTADLPDGMSGEEWTYAEQRWIGGEVWMDAYFRLSDGDQGAHVEVLRLMDDLTRNVAPEECLYPEWPLALALLRLEGDAHPDAAGIATEWRERLPFDGLTDPALLKLLGVDAEPVVVEPSVEGEIAFRDLVMMLRTARSDAEWLAATHRVMHARPRLTRDELPQALALVNTVSWVWNTGLFQVPAQLRPACRDWLRTAPFLALRESLSGPERADVDAFVLLAIGISPAERASPVQADFVADLLSSSGYHPGALVELLQAWQQRYREFNCTTAEQGRS